MTRPKIYCTPELRALRRARRHDKLIRTITIFCSALALAGWILALAYFFGMFQL